MNCSFHYRIHSHLATRTSYIIFNVLTALLATTGNILILTAVFKSLRLRTTSNYFLCSLAVSDFLVGVVAAPLNILRIEPSLSSSYLQPIGKSFDFCVLQTLIATTFNLVLVSIDRYIAIKWPLNYLRVFTPKFIAVAIGIVWVSSMVLAFPGLFLYGEGLMIHWLVTVLVTLMFPLAIISFCYVEILKIAKRQQKMHPVVQLRGIQISIARRQQRTHPVVHVQQRGEEQISIARRQQKTHPVVQQRGEEQINTEFETRKNIKNRKASITFAIITGVFLVSFAPNLMCNIAYAFVFKPCSKLPEYFYWTNSIMFMSSSLNPLVYGARNRDFRLAFRRLMMSLRGCT